MALFAYESQKQVINQQVTGWEKKTKTTLAKGGTQGGCQGGSVQEKGEGEEEEKGEDKLFGEFWNLYNKKVDRFKSHAKWNKLKQQDKEQIMLHLPNYIKSTPDVKFRKNPVTYLNSKMWEDEAVATVVELPPLAKLVAHIALQVPEEFKRLTEKGYTKGQLEKYAGNC